MFAFRKEIRKYTSCRLVEFINSSKINVGFFSAAITQRQYESHLTR